MFPKLGGGRRVCIIPFSVHFSISITLILKESPSRNTLGQEIQALRPREHVPDGASPGDPADGPLTRLSDTSQPRISAPAALSHSAAFPRNNTGSVGPTAWEARFWSLISVPERAAGSRSALAESGPQGNPKTCLCINTNTPCEEFKCFRATSEGRSAQYPAPWKEH